METMGDESVRDVNAPRCHRGSVVERATVQWRKIQTGPDCTAGLRNRSLCAGPGPGLFGAADLFGYMT